MNLYSNTDHHDPLPLIMPPPKNASATTKKARSNRSLNGPSLLFYAAAYRFLLNQANTPITPAIPPNSSVNSHPIDF
jgi:hypothetical protein